jgi:predicted HicB family RNase H-like nuclease
MPSVEKKTSALSVRLRPSIKAKLVKFAEQDGRSLANYIERLIEADAEKRARKK